MKSLLLCILTIFCGSTWAAGCGFMISPSASSLNEIGYVTITPSASAQSFLPSQTDLLPQTQNSTITYWGRNQNSVSKTIILKPEDTVFTADPNNIKGWLVDSSVPGLYFILSVNMPQPNGTNWGNFSPAMLIYLSSNSSINQTTPASGSWGCSSSKNDTYFQTGTMTFSLSFYTTAAFDPAQAAGKQVLVGSKRAGTLDNTQDSGGEFQISLQGPLTISTAGCGAFSADETVNLGEIPLKTLQASPDDEHNKKTFQVTLKNCYAKPTLVVNLSTNQSKNNLLTNNRGSAKGVGVGLGYTTASNTSQRLNLSNPNTIDAKDLGYSSSAGNGILNMFAILGVTDKSALSAGSVDIPAVITLTNP
ncbi:hypothetical protein HV336_20075 [Citrobacter freundii]|uniref:hypothetical protein n=1 Tax=Citrobacter freundii TaxID=546 RepID=UPI0015EA9BBC|nr:hypothetical protein [Citrobacter freundii]QLR79021.1 hypothetical protein HV336_20075 [Citrobacter freundii]